MIHAPLRWRPFDARQTGCYRPSQWHHCSAEHGGARDAAHHAHLPHRWCLWRSDVRMAVDGCGMRGKKLSLQDLLAKVWWHTSPERCRWPAAPRTSPNNISPRRSHALACCSCDFVNFVEFVRLTLQLQSGKDLHREILAACWQRHALCEKQIEIELFELRHFFVSRFCYGWTAAGWPMTGGMRSGSGRRWQNSNRRVGAWLLCDSPGWCLDALSLWSKQVETRNVLNHS